MKWLLISMMLNNPMVYADEATCNKAVKAISKMDPEAVCIPAGVDEGEEPDRREGRIHERPSVFRANPIGQVDAHSARADVGRLGGAHVIRVP